MTSRLLSFINQSRTIFSADQIDNTVFLIGHSINIIRLKSLKRKKNYIHKMINIILSILAVLRNIQKRFILGKSPLNYILFFYKDSSALNFQQICKELLVQLIHITQLPGYTVSQNYTKKCYIRICLFSNVVK